MVVLDYYAPPSQRLARWGFWLMLGSFVCALPVLVVAELSSLGIDRAPLFALGPLDDQNLLAIGIQTSVLGIGLGGAAMVVSRRRLACVGCVVANLVAFVVGPQFTCA